MQTGKAIKLTDHFYVHEFASPDTGECRMDQHFMDALELLRMRVDVEFTVSSGYRTPEYNALKGGAEHGMHPKGIAADIDHQHWDGATKFRFLAEATAMGFSIGIYKKHFHIDLRNEPIVLWIDKGIGC